MRIYETKLIAKQLYNDDTSKGVFSYLLEKEGENFDIYVSGFPSTTSEYSTAYFYNVYHYVKQDVDWWSDNIENQYVVFMLHHDLALRITNYSFVTYSGSYEGDQRACGLVDWRITYFFKDIQLEEKEYHSDKTDVRNAKFTFPIGVDHNPLITRLKLQLIGRNSRTKEDYILSLNQFELYGYLYQIPICTCNYRSSFFKISIFNFIFLVKI